ncbi:MAG: phage tail protein [Gemmatimonadota bacterium]
MSRALNRLDVRATYGGPTLGTVPLEDVLDGVEEWTDGDQEAVTFTVNRESESWALLQHRRVLVQVFEDGTEAPWRIARETEAQDGATGETAATVRAEAPLLDLADTDLVSHEEVDGTVVHTFAPWGLTPAEHLSLVAPVLPAGWSIGSVESTEHVEVQYDNDTALSAAYAIAEAAGLVVDWTAAGAGNFVLHLRDPEVTDDSEAADLRYGLNVAGIELETDSTQLAARIYPHGAAEDGVRAGIEEAAWEVEVVDSTGTRLRLPAECIAFDGQMDSRYVELAGTTTRIEVVQTVAASREVVVAAPGGIQPGDLIQFRATATGRQLTYLDNPATAARWPLPRKVAQVNYDDVPNIQNLLPAAFFDVLEGDAPRGWERVGTLTELRLETSPLFVRHGTASAYFATSEKDAGLASRWTPYSLSVLRWYLSLQAVLYLAEGALRMEFEVENDQGEVRVFPPAAQAVWATPGWADNWGVSPGELAELEGWGARRVRARFVNATNRPLRVYLDAAMLTPTPNGAAEFAAGRAANTIWTRTLEELAAPARTGPQLAAKVDVVDLYAADPDAFRYYELPKRGVVRVQHEPLGADFRTRIVGRKRSAVTGQVLEVQLDTRILSLTDRLARDGKRGRRGTPLRNSAQGGVDISIEQVERSAAGVKLRLTATSSMGQRVAIFHRGDRNPSSRVYTRVPALPAWEASPYVFELLVTPPAPGKAVVVIEAYAAAEGGGRSPVRPATVDASDQAGITNFVVSIDRETGFPCVRADVDSDARSVRFAHQIGTNPAEPTDAEAEAGTVVPVVSGTAVYVGTTEVPRGQMVRAAAAPYQGADGTGPGGATDHGPVRRGQADRPTAVRPAVVWFERAAGLGRSHFKIQVRDPHGSGTLYVWTNPFGYDSPDPTTAQHDGVLAINGTQVMVPETADFTGPGGALVRPLQAVLYHAGRGKKVCAAYVSGSGEATGYVFEAVSNILDKAIDALGEVAAGSIRLATQFGDNIVPVMAFATAPTTYQGSNFVAVGDPATGAKPRMYVWSGPEASGSYAPLTAALDGTVLDGDIDPASNFARIVQAKTQASIAGGGDITWSPGQVGTRFFTTQRFISVPNPLSVSGYFDFGPVDVEVPPYQGLYFRVKVGGQPESGNHPLDATGTGFFVTPHTSYAPPSLSSGFTDFLIGVHNGDNSLFYLFDGRVLRPGETIQGGQFIPLLSVRDAHIVTLHGNKLIAHSVGADQVITSDMRTVVLAASRAEIESLQAGFAEFVAVRATAIAATTVEADTVDTIRAQVGTLAELLPDLGIIQEGKLRSIALRPDGTPMMEFDLNATGAQAILNAVALVIRADGSGSWRGLVEADEFLAHEAKFYSLRMRARPDLPALPRGIFFPGGGHLSDNGGTELNLSSPAGIGLAAPLVETSSALTARGLLTAAMGANVTGTLAADAVTVAGRPAAGVIISTGDPSGGPYPAGTLWCKVA